MVQRTRIFVEIRDKVSCGVAHLNIKLPLQIQYSGALHDKIKRTSQHNPYLSRLYENSDQM